jgi:sugar phosphate isomerase/epimerase
MRRREFLSTVSGAAWAGAADSGPAGVRLGINTYCLRFLRWTDAQLLEYCAGLKLDAVMLQDSLDPQRDVPAHWTDVRQDATRRGLLLQTGGGAILPKAERPTGALLDGMRDYLRREIARAAAMGSSIVRAVLVGERAAFPPGPVEQHLETATRILRSVRDDALRAGLKIALENHKDLQAWEMRALIEAAGPEFVGSYLDTGNAPFVLEHPLVTLETLAPYAVNVHLGDAVIYEHPRGVAVQRVPLGEGTVDFRALVKRLGELQLTVPVFVKPITARVADVFPLYDEAFWKRYPKARAAELIQFVNLMKKGAPYDRPMVIEDVPGRAMPPHFAEALKFQQREHLERSVTYAKQVLGLGVKWRT